MTPYERFMKAYPNSRVKPEDISESIDPQTGKITLHATIHARKDAEGKEMVDMPRDTSRTRIDPKTGKTIITIPLRARSESKPNTTPTQPSETPTDNPQESQ